MRRVRYQVAVSLDGFIAGPGGEFDWIPADPDVDFAAMYRQYDTILVGRKTFGVMVAQGNASIPGMKVFVVSRTLRQRDYPDATIVNGDCARAVRSASSNNQNSTYSVRDKSTPSPDGSSD